MKNFIWGLTAGLCLMACRSESEKIAEEDPKELAEVEQIAFDLEEAFNTYQPYEIKSIFDPSLFAWRLGNDFKNLTPTDRQLGYSVFDSRFDALIDESMMILREGNMEATLFDIHQKDQVYRLNYAFNNRENNKVYDHLTVYLDKNRDQEWKIVNIYNVFYGFSYGQMMKEYVDRYVISGSRGRMRELENSSIIRDRSLRMALDSSAEQAYELIKTLPNHHQKQSIFAFSRLRIAALVSDSLLVEELDWMRQVTPNEQSRIAYDCRSLALSGADEDRQKECQNRLEELLRSL
ncbi:hypothetical protein [Nonlabens xiamenensis]|uniref:hypothetical protein n=1 Tax=Nonlabens xiamenensis TaxID=2341043 RepID=UPI000F60C2B1|nr:hypothetical protein [Nonlabens xiamenensis]